MTEEVIPEAPLVENSSLLKEPPRTRKNIVHFTGEKPIAINLDHVSIMRCEAKTIYFDFYTKTQPVDFADETSAKSVLQALMNIWSDDVLE